jgi:hypothetical protein
MSVDLSLSPTMLVLLQLFLPVVRPEYHWSWSSDF